MYSMLFKRQILVQTMFFMKRHFFSSSSIQKLRNTRFQSNEKLASKIFKYTSFGMLGIFEFGKEEEEPEPELIMTIKRSIILIQQGEYKKAEQMLHVALRQAQTLQHYDGITYVYDVMANLAFEVDDIEKARNLFVVVMQRLMANGALENDMRMIHISLKLARLYEMSKEFDKAEDGYLFCLKHVQDHANNNPDDEDVLIMWAMTLDWYAKMLFSQSRLKEALKCYLQAYELCQKVHGKHHEQTVILLNDLGTVYCLLGDYEQAVNHLSEAILIGRGLSEMPDLSSIHINLGNVYLKKTLYNEAKKSCSIGLRLAEEKNDNESQEQAKACLAEVNKLLSQS